jgi:hypothetical protein
LYTISGAFKTALQSPTHTIRVRMDVLDTNFNVVSQFHDIGSGDAATDILIDGNVDVDVTRFTRRTFSANALNPAGIWSPGSDWGGTFYVNRMVRLWRGIDYGSGYELVPLGTFMIDAADVEVERSMSVVTLSGSDLWKKFGKSAFGSAKSWAVGTHINTIITYIASQCGVTLLNLDPLSSRASGDNLITKVFAVERADNRGEALGRLATAYGIDIYFDPLGRLTTQDFRAPGDVAVVYEYGPTKNNNLISIKATFTDDNLYNSVLVYGTGDKNTAVAYKIRDTNPNSVTNITRIGERVLIYQSDTITTAAVAQATALRLFYKNVLVNEDITLDAICNPAYEGNDVISVVETDYSKMNDTFRIKAFTVPLSTSRQTIRLLREIKLT